MKRPASDAFKRSRIQQSLKKRTGSGSAPPHSMEYVPARGAPSLFQGLLTVIIYGIGEGGVFTKNEFWPQSRLFFIKTNN